MYNAHRGMMPQHQPPNNRLTELLDQIRVEFDNQAGQAGRDEHQRESFSMLLQESHIASHTNALSLTSSSEFTDTRD